MTPDWGHRQTDKLLEELEERIAREYDEAYRDLHQKVEEYFDAFRDRDAEQLRRLDEGKITEHQYYQWRIAQIGRGKRFEALRDQMAERYTHANEVAISYVNDATPGVYSLNRNYTNYTIERHIGDCGFTLYDESTVRRLIVDKPDSMPYYPPERAVQRGFDLAFGKRQITASVTGSILLGRSIKGIADDLQQRIDTMSRTSAIRAARTASTCAQNAGRQDSYDAAFKMGIKVRKRWVATKDNRTRHEHGKADGQTVPHDCPFDVGGYKLMFPGDATGPAHLIYNCRCTMRTAEKDGIEAEPRQMRVRNPATGRNELVNEMTYSEWEAWKRAEQQEGEIADTLRRTAKSAAGPKKVVGFTKLPKEMQQSFRSGLAGADPTVRKALRRVYKKADYAIVSEHRSYYTSGPLGGTVTLGKASDGSTIAHELFHKLDKGHKISMKLATNLAQDFAAINVASSGDARGYLAKKYPTAFRKASASGLQMLKPEYRGVSDILNGLSGGKEYYGFGHKEDYWSNPGALEAEAWAQLGRIYFENNEQVVKMFKEVFPNFNEGAIMALKEMI